jgi:hypothetical protein
MDVCLLPLYVVLSCVVEGGCDGLITRPSWTISACEWMNEWCFIEERTEFLNIIWTISSLKGLNTCQTLVCDQHSWTYRCHRLQKEHKKPSCRSCTHVVQHERLTEWMKYAMLLTRRVFYMWLNKTRFQVVTTASMKITAFWDITIISAMISSPRHYR